MAKNKKKKSKQEVEKNYGTGIAPVSNKFTLNTQSNKTTSTKKSTKKKESTKKVETTKKDTTKDTKTIAPVEVKGNDKFTITSPVKQKTEEEQAALNKKQQKSASAGGYVAKKAASGLLQSGTGLVDAPLQNLQEGAEQGKGSSRLKNIARGYIKSIDLFGLTNIPENARELSNIAADPNLSVGKKIVQSGLAILNDNPIVQSIEGTGRLAKGIDKKADKHIATAREKVNKPAESFNEKLEEESKNYSGAVNTVGNAVQVTANMIPSIVASSITQNPNVGLAMMGVSAKGNATREAEKKGATLSQANDIGFAKGLTEVLTEKMYSGFGKVFGKGALDDVARDGLNRIIKNKGLNYVAKKGLDIAGEFFEETVSDLVDLAIDKSTVDPDAKYSFKDWLNTGLMTTLSTIMLNGITGGYLPNSYIENSTELEKSNQTDNVQKIIESELEERINDEYKGKATAREIANLQKEIIEDINNGYISTEKIEKTLGGETYNQLNELNKQQANIQNQINELERKAERNELESLEEKQKLEDLKKQIKEIDNTELKNQLTNEVNEIIKNDKGLQESYLENNRRKENFFVDLNTIQDETQRSVYQKAMDSGVLNNSNKTHALVDMIAKISAEKNINFDFTNNEQLENSGFGVNGRNINGYVTDSGITINLNSSKAINRIVGHELTHTFEGTTLYTELQDSLKDFLGSEWDNQLAKYKELYKGVKNANIENELTSDLIGDYLFTDENYVRNLSTQHKNLFEKIYDEIKYLYNLATAGSKERRMLEKVKRTFDRIYNETESKTTSEDTKYSITGIEGAKQLAKTDSNYQYVVDNYNTALELKKNNKKLTNEDIRQITGWFQDKYNTWKYEVSDDLEAAYLKETPEKNGSYNSLRDIFEHNILYKMYPGLEDVKLKFDDINSKGKYSKENNTIYINNDLINSYSDTIGTLLHEIQHYIQHNEPRFVSGTSASKGILRYLRRLGEIEAADTKNRRELTESERKAIAPETSKKNPIHPEREEILDLGASKLEKTIEPLYNKVNDMYEKLILAGEKVENFVNKNSGQDNSEIGKENENEDLGERRYRGVGNTSFSLDENAKRYEDLTKTKYIEYFTKDNGDVRINLMDSNNNLVNQFDVYNQREAINQLGEELGKQIYQNSSVDNQRFEIGNDINNMGTETDYFMTHRPTESGITADDLTGQGKEFGLPSDIYEHPEYYSMNKTTAKETMDQLNRVRNNPDADVIIYRATTGDKINKGDWVTLSRSYAEQHNESQFDGKGNIIEKVVKARDVQNAGDMLDEWGYFPESDNNTKYSLSQDSQGRELSNEIIEKTQYSKIRDEEGKLEPFYHGSNKNIDVFDSTRKPFYNNQNVNFFTSSENIGKTYGSNLQKVYINSINPYIFDGDTDGYSLEYSNTAKEEYRNNKEIIDSIRNKLDENGGRYYKKSVAKNCDAILENKGNILSNEEIDFLTEHPYTLASLSIKGKNGFVAYGNSVMTNDVVNAVLSINNKIDNKYDSVLFKSIKDSGQYYDENTLKEKSDVIATFDANQIVRDNDDIRYSLDIAPISKNLLTQAEQDELDGLRAVDNSGFAELTPEESKRMYELENRANTVLNKKAEKMLRSASYKAINTATKAAQSYLDFDANEKKSFRNQIREFSNMTKDELVSAETYNKVKDLVSQYANKEVTYVDDSIDGIKREIKHTKIKISDELKDQITDYGDFVKDSKLMLRRNSGQNVDSVYKEYSEMYPGFFDSDVWSEADQLEALNNFVNNDFSVTEKFRIPDSELKNATDIIYNKLLDNSLSMQDLIETEEILDKKAQIKTRSVVREELLNKMGITPELISSGNDISAISFARTDPVRVNEKVFGWKDGQLINDATVNFTKHQEAERIRFLNDIRQKVKDLGIKARSKESELVQKYGEKQYVDKDNVVHEYGDAELNRDVQDVATRNKIKNAAKVIRNIYDETLDRINSKLTEMGYDEIPKRKDYMMHFIELEDKFSQWGLPFNKESMMAEDLPTDINGLTEFNRPGKSYFASANARTGLQTTYDAITGIDKYIEGASNLIYHTESIQRYRALTRFIRENYGREHGLDNIDLMTDEELADRIKDIQDNKLSKYVAWLDEQANAIAGKKGSLDRSIERLFGRRVYTAFNTLKSQVGSNMTGFNPRSALTNFASMIQGASKTQKVSFAEGTVSTINNIIHDDGMIDKSDFLTRRFGSNSLSMKPWQKLSKAGQIFMEGTDYFTANVIWRSKYFENLHKGMSEEQAIKNADDFASRIMGDRSKGAVAELFNSKTLGFLSQFQLEVNNQWSSLIHDNKIDIQSGNKTALGVTFELGQLFAASYMFNTMMKALTGSDVMIDPIDMLLKIFKKDDDDDSTIVERAQKVLGEFINQLPFANLVTGGGRIPISEAFTGASTLGKKLMGGTDNYGNEITWEDVGEDFKDSLAYWVLPTGYGQIRKTVKGLSMYDDKLPIAGSYTKSGNLRFSAEDTTFGKIKAGLFGQYSSKYAQDYIDSGYKSINSSKLDEMKDLDMNSTEYREYRQGLSNAGSSVEDKLNYISDLDVSDEEKTIMASNVAKKDIDMSEYKKYGSYDEFNYAQKNPAKYEVMKLIGGYDTYKNYEKEIESITADYGRNGKAITNSRKNKVIKYVNSLNLTKAQKAMLIKEQYPSFTQYDSEIASYVNNQNMSFIEKAGVLKQLGFKAYDRQIIDYIRQNYRTVEEQQRELEKLGFKIYNYNGQTYVR